MRVLIFALSAVAAVSCTTILRSEGLTTEPPTWCQPYSVYSASTYVFGGGTCYCNNDATWCQPYSVYSASTYDVFGGGTCYCNNDGSIGHCQTVYRGSNFSYTQTSSDKRGNLGMCVADGTCFKVPLKRDLSNTQCNTLIQPAACTAEENGRTYRFTISKDDDVMDGSVTINGIYYEILPYMSRGYPRRYW